MENCKIKYKEQEREEPDFSGGWCDRGRTAHRPTGTSAQRYIGNGGKSTASQNVPTEKRGPSEARQSRGV